jgi:hypothetical protein
MFGIFSTCSEQMEFRIAAPFIQSGVAGGFTKLSTASKTSLWLGGLLHYVI